LRLIPPSISFVLNFGEECSQIVKPLLGHRGPLLRLGKGCGTAISRLFSFREVLLASMPRKIVGVV
jgi:hypothetical protein